MMSEELKPCPFCGGKPKIKSLNRVIKLKPWDDSYRAWFRCDPVFTIVCGKCGELRTFGYAPLDYAVESWNMRVISNTRKSKLKTCPFCGGEGEVISAYGGKFAATCGKPGCMAYLFPFDTKEEAIAAWNRRADNERA